MYSPSRAAHDIKRILCTTVYVHDCQWYTSEKRTKKKAETTLERNRSVGPRLPSYPTSLAETYVRLWRYARARGAEGNGHFFYCAREHFPVR